MWGVAFERCAISNRASLPPEVRPAAVCIYERMSLNPAIHDIGVYAIDGKSVVIVFGYWSKDRHDKTGELAILRIPATGKFGYRGDYSRVTDNPVGAMSETLNEACDVDGGYIDEVTITGSDNDPYRWLVDMSPYTKERSPN